MPSSENPPERSSGRRAAAAVSQEFSWAQAVGGPRGIVEAILPSFVFVLLFSVQRDLRTALIAAVAVAAVAVLARVVVRASPMQSLAGLAGVLICAWVSRKTGQAKDFYLPGLFINLGYAALYAVSALPWPGFTAGGRRFTKGPWPLWGLVLSPFTGEGLAWRQDPLRLGAYLRVTWLWVGLFLLRLVVQVPLYLGDHLVLLGTARVLMGVPLFGLGLWFTWQILRSVPPTVPAEHTTRDEQAPHDAQTPHDRHSAEPEEPGRRG